jgi:hypothetical protein
MNGLEAQKAALAQQQAVLADELAQTRESAGWHEAGQIAATATSQEQELLDEFRIAAPDWLVFTDPAPPEAAITPDQMAAHIAALAAYVGNRQTPLHRPE